MTDSSQQFLLPRTGLPPLQFEGTLLAEIVDPPHPFKKAKVDHRKWHKLRLYRTQKGNLVVGIALVAGNIPEPVRELAYVCEDEEHVLRVLSGDGEKPPLYNPADYLEPGRRRDEREILKEENRNARVIEDFQRRVGRLLAEAGIAEQVE